MKGEKIDDDLSNLNCAKGIVVRSKEFKQKLGFTGYNIGCSTNSLLVMRKMVS